MYHIQIKVNQNPTMHHPHNVGYDRVLDELQLHCSFHLVHYLMNFHNVTMNKIVLNYFGELHGNFLVIVGFEV
jgi:hypothetical protein